MKVILKNMVTGFTGSADDMIYYYNRKLNRCYARRRPVVSIRTQHHRLKAVMENLKHIHPSAGFKADLDRYLAVHNALPKNKWCCLLNWSNVYMKLLYALADRDESIDLTCLTREDIYALDLPCKSVKRAVEAGLLPKVKGYEAWVEEI